MLPETPFECPKLNRGDRMSLDVGRRKGPRILTPVKVVDVDVDISWDAIGTSKNAKINDAEQYLFVEPVILEKIDNS